MSSCGRFGRIEVVQCRYLEVFVCDFRCMRSVRIATIHMCCPLKSLNYQEQLLEVSLAGHFMVSCSRYARYLMIAHFRICEVLRVVLVIAITAAPERWNSNANLYLLCFEKLRLYFAIKSRSQYCFAFAHYFLVS